MKKFSELQKKLFTFGLMAVGLFFIVVGIIGVKNAKTFSPTKGVIQSIEVEEGIGEDDPDTYTVMVEYTVDGKTYVSDLGENGKDYAVGKEIDILYNPNNPEVITKPGTMMPIIAIAVGLLAFVIPLVLMIRKKSPKVQQAKQANIYYEPSVKGEERELYFLTDLGTAKIGHQLEDANRVVLYEAKVTKFTVAKPTEMDFIDHVNARTTPRLVGHEVSVEYSSPLIDSRFTFTFDGEDIWNHLQRNGITVKTTFAQGKFLTPEYHIFRDGEEIAYALTTSQNVHEEDEEAKSKLSSLVPVRGFMRVWTKEQNLDLLFLTLMAFARTAALDDEGGQFGAIFGK
ncbi:MAG: DUF3592 domain-containing protein [Lachnospiraceae bacterium]|nr:DUF3592 domain-containing protein [Lachnospiraceae bacterium]